MARKYFKRKQETPKQETPKQETPKQETPKQETPKQETPKQETPKKTEFKLKMKNTYNFLKKIKDDRVISTTDVRNAWVGSEKEADKIIKKFTNLEKY